MLKWLKRIFSKKKKSRIPESLEIWADGKWQPARILGRAGLMLTVSQRDSKTGRVTTMLVGQTDCRDEEVFQQAFEAFLAIDGESLVWESGEPYNPTS